MTHARPMPKIGVLCGGVTSERDISLKSGRAVFDGLKAAHVPAQLVVLENNDEQQIVRQLEETDIRVVFIALHGRFGEDGVLQEILERHGIAYTGSGPQACRLTMDKIATQRFLHQKGFRIPAHHVVSRKLHDTARQVAVEIHQWPVVVKPACEGSSFGVTVVAGADGLDAALQSAFKYDENVMIEDFIEGQEITAGILDGRALPLVAIRPRQGFFDFNAKYTKGETEYRVPAPLPSEVTRRIQQDAEAIFSQLGCRDFGRLDFICNREGEACFLELNAVPGFTETSLLPKAADHDGLKFPQLCRRIAELAVNRMKEVPTNG